MKEGCLFSIQIVILWGINRFGYWLADLWQLPLPGNVLGMLLLFMLLVTKVIKVEWVERGAAFLNKHLTFFFIPIAVGLMMYGELIVKSGLALAAVVFGSSLIGLVITGGVTQTLAKRAEKEVVRNEQHHSI
ncbi:CidA/LrgA family protein [Bacillus xiapuensis]|uniref:CidA/LrgA family protein n=1 Tax=Bacillus xiapuensis TaxID=2014075 RepID=UPI000C249A0E|nr:CidA/LrgA family protein [Bacillus xiapuensis]